ncbi:CHAT domain-containing protein [Streptomyces sp. CG 926]|uniref:CHAT domain-containing protein n=1 Tax=Streptomyces sp. CG 926 TaxID=1882405 RepID=UPI000D6D4C91|nr:CHAT domain-containing protein [Streptomyces sp. CG 926]PWK66851.1 CHAT domain-containing protein [Streptomyces sp. CG 926]
MNTQDSARPDDTLAAATERALAALGVTETPDEAGLHRLRTPVLLDRSPDAVEEVRRTAARARADGDDHLLGRALFMLAQYAWQRDDYPSTVENADLARAAYERAGDRVGVARAAQSRANVLRITSHRDAEAALTEALLLARRAQDGVTEATLWLDLALVAQKSGDTATYAARIEEAERCLRPSLLAAGHAARNLGEVKEQRRDVQAARESYGRAVRLYEDAGAPAPATATVLLWWGRTERVQGDAERSRELLEAAVRKATSGGGDLVAEAESRRELAMADKLAGNLREAMYGYRRARSALRRIDGVNPLTLANIEFELGELLGLLSGPEHSRRHFEEAYRWYREADEPRGLHNSARELAELAMDEGDPSTARDLLTRAVAPLGRQTADPMNRLRMLTSLGRLLSLEASAGAEPRRHHRRAERILTAALSGFEQLGQLRNEALVLLVAVRGGIRVGGYSPVEAGEEAIRRYAGANDRLGEIEGQWALSQAWLRAGDERRALAHGRSALLAIEEVRATSPDAVTRAGFLHGTRSAALPLLMPAVSGDPAFAEQWLESARDWAITGALRTGVADLSPAFRRLHADLKRHEDERPPEGAPAAQRTAWQSAHRALHEQLFFAFTQSLPTTEQRAGSATGETEPEHGPDEIDHHRLGAREYALYVELFTGADRTVEVVSVCRHPNGSLEAGHGPLSPEAVALLTRFRDGEDIGQDGEPSLRADPAWSQLADRLLPSGLASVLAACAETDPIRLFVLPANELWNVPYAALPLSGSTGQLVDKAVITLTPSMRILSGRPEQQGRPRGPGREHRVVGLFPTDAPMGELELERLEKRTPVRRASSYDQLAAALAEGAADLLYCAAHGEAGHRPGQDILTEAGALNDWSVLELAVPATVVLGCCGSGRIWHQPGSEPSGLALSFMLAGARQVVAPIKKVHGSTCAALLPELAERVLDGRSPAAALRDLQRRARDDPKAPRLREEWHLFHCVGTVR